MATPTGCDARKPLSTPPGGAQCPISRTSTTRPPRSCARGCSRSPPRRGGQTPWSAGRPYADLDSLLDASDELVASLDGVQVDAALAGHPRIGDSGEGLDRESAARSAAEQSGMAAADAATRDAMARGNAAYEARFGRIYLVAAAGRSAEEMLLCCASGWSTTPSTSWTSSAASSPGSPGCGSRGLVGGPMSISTHVLTPWTAVRPQG